MKWFLMLLAQLLITWLVDGCTSQRDRDDIDRKFLRHEQHYERKLNEFRKRRDEGDPDVRPRPFRPGAAPLGSPAAGASPAAAAPTATGRSSGERTALKVETGL